MDSRLNFRRLEIFCLVVEEGGVTRAAERLYVAQPGVSSQLRALEHWLGAKLFARDGARFELTEAGERAYAWARSVLASGAEVQREVAGISDGTGGSVIIAASMGVGTYFLPLALADLRRERPNADITLSNSLPHEALHLLELGRSDFAVLSWDGTEAPAGVVHELLFDEPLVLVAAPDGPPDAASVSIRQLSDLPFVWVPRGGAFAVGVEQQLRVHHVDPMQIMMRLGHAEAMKLVVRGRRWTTILPRFAVEEELEAGLLRAVDVEDVEMVDSIGLFFREGKSFSTLQKAAIDSVRAVVDARLGRVAPVAFLA